MGTHTCTMLMNLVAYEVSKHSIVVPSTLCYVLFLKCLLHTPDDVQHLVNNGILLNGLPNHISVFDLFNSVDTFGYGYNDLSTQVWLEIGHQSITTVCVGSFLFDKWCRCMEGIGFAFFYFLSIFNRPWHLHQHYNIKSTFEGRTIQATVLATFDQW